METHQESSASTSQDSVPTSQDDHSAPKGDLPKPKTYSEDDYKRKSDDMHRYKQERNDLRKEMEDLKSKQLEDDENWKVAYEREKEIRQEVETDLSQFKDGFFKDKKFNEVRTLAIKAGLRPEAERDLELFDMDSVRIERTDQGRVLVHGADTFVEGLKKTRPYLFRSKNVPTFNTGGGGVPPDKPTELSAEYMTKLEREDSKKYRELMPEYQRQLRERRSRY